MASHLAGIRSSWSDAWRDGRFRFRFLLSFVAALPIVFALPHFFGWLENRPGAVLNDPLLDALGPIDLSVFTFALLYGGLFLAVPVTVRHPQRLLRGMHAYLIMVGMRMCTMAMFTLEAPQDIIPLVVPVTLLFYPGKEPFLKDLFFSGHTATLIVAALMVPVEPVRYLIIGITCAVGMAVLAQHVHWTVDVLAAPIFAWAAWRSAHVSARAIGAA